MFESPQHSALFKITNVIALGLQAVGFFLMFLTPALFGFLFSAAVGTLVAQATGSQDAMFWARIASMVVYGLLYVTFVAAHAKRPGGPPRQSDTTGGGLVRRLLAVLVQPPLVVLEGL